MKKLFILSALVLASFAQATTFVSNQSNIRVPGTGTGGTTTGSAGVYPITFTVSGFGANVVSDVNISLNWSTGTVNTDTGGHSFADDIDVLLVNPAGVAVLFLSDAGGSANWGGLYTFDDEAAAAVTDSNPSGVTTSDFIANGSYQVSSYSTGDVFLAPAPGVWGSLLSDFDGGLADGTWSMYIMDDVSGDIGMLVDARLDVEAVPEPATMILLSAGAAAIAARRRKKA